jgi:hypothetical protein
MRDMRSHEHNMDTNTLLENRAVEWQGRAEEAEAAADRAEEMADHLDRGGAGVGASHRAEATALREQATRHRERAAAAENGRLLIHPDDMDWQLKNNDLHSRCAAEGRLTYPKGTVRTG